MRISDWSSDVCSSDLRRPPADAMPAWQIVLIVAALVAAAFVVAIVVRLWRDPYALVRAEFARQRMALGFARRTIDVDGIRWVYAEGGSRDPDRTEEHTSELQ